MRQLNKQLHEEGLLPPRSQLETWTVFDVTNWLHKVCLSECVSPFQESNIDGKKLANLKDKAVRSMQDVPKDKYKIIMNFVRKIPKDKMLNKKPEVPAPDYQNAHTAQSSDYEEGDEFDTDEWSDDDGYQAGDYENDEDWTGPQRGLNCAVDAPPDDGIRNPVGDYLVPQELAHRANPAIFMEPPASHGLGGPPTRQPPPPPTQEPAPPALPTRGRLPMPPREEPVPKATPPAPPKPVTKAKPTPPAKPAGNKIMAITKDFEQMQIQARPQVAPKPPKTTAPSSFLHRPQIPRMQNGFAASNEEEEDKEDYEIVDPGDKPVSRPQHNGPPLPARNPEKPEVAKTEQRGMVPIFPGIRPGSEFLKKRRDELKTSLDVNRTEEQPRVMGARKWSEPAIITNPRPPPFTKQKSFDQVLDAQLPHRPLPTVPITPPERIQTDRPLPPLPPNSGLHKIRPPRTDRPLPAPPQSEEEITIYSFPWYFGDMNRAVASEKIRAQTQEGVFLVRKSKQGAQNEPYTLIFFDGNKVHNLHIRRRPDNKYALGKEKDTEMAFRSVPELIQFHQTNAIALAGGAKTILTTCPPRH